MLRINVLPLHVNPSPLYPESHVQMKDPSVLLQVAFAWQGETGRHSFVSTVK
jgi:hypothetical protein